MRIEKHASNDNLKDVNKPSDLSDVKNPNDDNKLTRREKLVDMVLNELLKSPSYHNYSYRYKIIHPENKQEHPNLKKFEDLLIEQNMWDDVIRDIVKKVDISNDGKKSINVNISDYLMEKYKISKK